MLHSRKLLYINEIAKCGSIRKAAERMNVASSAVNRQILALEEELGAPIFERLPRGLRLTSVGELCVEHIRDVLKNYEKLQGRIKNLKTPQAGKVSLVTTIGLAAGPLPSLMARFLEEHPRIRVLVRSDGGVTTSMPVIAGEVDLGLGFNIPALPGIRSVANFDVPLGAVLPVGHPLAERERISIVDMMQEPLLLALPGTSLRDTINLAVAPLPISVEPILETNSSEMIKALIRKGAGVSFLNPLDVLMECRRGELVYRPLTDAHVRPQPMKLFARARASLDPATSVFIEFLLGELIEMIREVTEPKLA
ncbi:LysR family transcriptional regulator [Oryzibacter oryziterrae]|uniref:LysR family transcriptional regulator n=1 Tax=Oryzibacter oryziterrae TaxID=2766474 RepID=UPI001F38E7A7|nr:LysR family transcriptional regulator [Oryzibacter oryziterrae]